MQVESFILASASPQRRKLLTDAGMRFEVQPSRFVEPPWPGDVAAGEWATALATGKAREVAGRNHERWVLGADTVVWCEGELLGKPIDRKDAERMLRLQAGRCCEVITGLCLVRMGRDAREIVERETTRVWMREDEAEMQAYLASGDWAEKAGAYGIQSLGDRLVERVEGSFSNVVGLPLERVCGMLKAVGLL